MKRFIFDVDGTLTPSRQKMDPEFQKWFIRFQEHNFTYLVTGSDKDKSIEQVGSIVYNFATRVYNCSGSDVWEQNTNIRTNNWTLPEPAHGWLSEQLGQSGFPLRTGLHFEYRPGMVNFSVVGRNATLGERKFYVEWDVAQKERDTIANKFNELFPDLEAKVGGETGIDVHPKGFDKSQILRDFDPNDELHFFGDAMHPEGNDYPLKKQIIDKDLGLCYNIKNWEETWKILRKE